MSGLLISISRLSRHEHHRLWRLARLRALVHHHGRTTTGTGVATMRLRRGCMLRIGVGRRRRVHLHLRRIRRHALGHTHIRAVGSLLHHHRGSHSSLRIHELRATLILSHVGRLRPSVELRHELPKCQLCMRGHRRRIPHVALSHAG